MYRISCVLMATIAYWCGGHFIIELTRQGRMDEMTVHAEARPERWDGSGLADHAEKVTTCIKNTIGITPKCGSSRRTRWNARSARPSACSTSGRRPKDHPSSSWPGSRPAHPRPYRGQDVDARDLGPGMTNSGVIASWSLSTGGALPPTMRAIRIAHPQSP
jgi:hypothetical protein